MNAPIFPAFNPRHLRRATGLVALVWTLAFATSVAWNARLLHDARLDAAANNARNSFNKTTTDTA